MAELGAPTKYNDNLPSELVDHMSKGLSFESFASVAHVSKDTLYDWTDPKSPRFKPDFSDAKKEGVSRCLLFWERIGVHAALNLGMTYKDEFGNEHAVTTYNATIWIFNMKNRFGWRDKTDVTSDDKPMDNTGHDALKAIAEALKNANQNTPPNDPTRSTDQQTGDAGTGESPN